MKSTTRKPIQAFCLAAILSIMSLMLLTACTGGVSSPSGTSEASGASISGSASQGAIEVQIEAPSAHETIIAPGRQFKVSGLLSGKIPDDATLRVSLFDSQGRELRYAAADRKGVDRVVDSWYKGDITVFAEGTDFSDVAYTAPELAVADTANAEASGHDATVKCVYTDTTFYALIVSATDSEHGLVEEDGYDLVDHDGNPYDALSEGSYTLQVELTSADGKELASASEEVEIGHMSGTIIHEMTNETVNKKGGYDLVFAWAADTNMKMLNDLLPGMFGPYYQMSTMQLSVSCETAEYLPGKIALLLYGNTAKSTSYCLEVAKYLQLQHTVENPDIASYYAFDLGEPRFRGKQAQIVALSDDESMRICRIDCVSDETQDGVFLTTEEQVLSSDIDSSDGWTIAADGAFAIAGVMKPYQLRDDELVPDQSIYGYYKFLNGADSLIYTFASADGSDVFTVTKPVGASRIDKLGDELDPALYEFYNVFPAGTLRAGGTYYVSVQGRDRYGADIKGMTLDFTLRS